MYTEIRKYFVLLEVQCEANPLSPKTEYCSCERGVPPALAQTTKRKGGQHDRKANHTISLRS